MTFEYQKTNTIVTHCFTKVTRFNGFIWLVARLNQEDGLDPSVPLVHGVAAPLKIVCCPQPSYYAVAPVSHVGANNTLTNLAFQKMWCFEIGFHKCLLFTLFQHTACDNCDNN